MKKNYLAVFGLSFAVAVMSAVVIAPQATAQFAEPVDNGDNTGTHTELLPACQNPNAASSPNCSTRSTGENPLTGERGVIPLATRIMATVTGLAAVVMMMIGGFRYVTSNGDAAKAASARRTLIYSAVGIVVVLSASMIISFALRRL